MCISFLPGDVGRSGQPCLAFSEKAVCPRYSHTAVKWENFGGPAARTDILNGTFFYGI